MGKLLRFGILVLPLVLTASVRADRPAPGDPGPPKRPNILFIAIDDLRPELGCYGATHVRSPRLDALAGSGATFLNAHCQVAVCNPSRASLMTGRYPDSIRVWDLRAHFRDLNPDIITLPQHFKEEGYTAVAYGKIFHNPLPDRRSWSEPNHWPKGRIGYSEEDRRHHAAVRSRLRDEGRPEPAVRRIRPPATAILETDSDDDVLDGAIAAAALDRMKELAAGESPFFLAVGFIRPHLAFLAPRKYWELYERDKIPLVADQSPPAGAPPFAMNTMYELRDYCDFVGTPSPLEGPLAEDQQRRLKHGYLACVSFVDAQVGRLLDGLERLGIADNTVVVVWGDHGWKLGEHRSWCKQTNYEIDTRVPLLVRAPGMEKGLRIENPVELVDLFPTLCQLAGLEPPRRLEGESLAPFLTSTIRSEPGTPSAAGEAYSQFQRRVDGRRVMGYALRTESHRLVEWRDWTSGGALATELYDHNNDGGEETNVADRAANHSLVESLRDRLHEKFPPHRRPVLPGLQSLPSPTRATLRITNRLQQPLKVWWIDTSGSRQARPTIAPGTSANYRSRAGHVFAVESEDGTFHGLAYPGVPEASFVVGLEGAAPTGRIEKIRISEDGARFVTKGSGREFRPWGVNYDHDDRSGALLEDYWEEDWDTVVEDFAEIAALGANTVRIHLQLGKFMTSANEANADSFTRLRKLVELAEKNRLYLNLTGLGCYHKDDVPEWYDALPEAGRWEVQARFWEAVARTCAGQPAVFCYDLMNEPILPGKNQVESEWLTGELAGKHFVQRISLDLAGRSRAEVAKAWVQRMVAAIRTSDPDTLVTVGVIPWAHVWPQAKPFFYSPEVGGPLDFVSVHFYPKSGEIEKALAALKKYDLGKPLVVEETFPLKCSAEELERFMAEGSGELAEGWISFYWGKSAVEYEADPEGGLPAALKAAWLRKFTELAPGPGSQ